MEQQVLQLKDIHLPSAISYWPLAPGWWILLFIILLFVLAWYFRASLRAWLAPGIRKVSLRQLGTIVNNRQTSNQQKVQQISQLLRQNAMTTSSRDHVAGLAGEQWLKFLDGDDPQQPFSNGVGRSLIDAPYQTDAVLDIDALAELVHARLKQNKKRKDRES